MNNSDYPDLDILDTVSDLDAEKVFTPPKVANLVLDLFPQEIWHNPDIKILDPVSKSGIFLREASKRLMEGLETEIPNEKDRRNHILTNMIFGIATEYVCSMISRRTLYYSKNASSNFSAVKFDRPDGNIHFERQKHDIFAGKCLVCGGKEELENNKTENFAYPFIHNSEFFKDMNFDVIVGNPPYQLEDGGNDRSSSPIYHHFVKQAFKLNPRYVGMIIPSRWFAGGKGLTDFRKELINDKRIVKIVDYENAKEIFPSVGIDGGVCYFLWDKNNKSIPQIINKNGDEEISKKRSLDKYGDIFIRWNNALPILDKVKAKSASKKHLNQTVSSRKPFGLATNFNEFSMKKSDSKNILKVYGLGKRIDHVERKHITNNIQMISKYKVLVSYVKGISTYPDNIILKPFIAGPGEICKEQYLVLDWFSTEEEANKFINYIETKLVRFLIALRKISKHNTSEVWSYVPYPDLDKDYTNEMLYNFYELTKKEIDFIDSKVTDLNT
jgi:site-specific DNA-methyltransferase (adenine-specific)